MNTNNAVVMKMRGDQRPSRVERLRSALVWSGDMKPQTAPAYLVKGMLDIGSTAMVVGAPNAGKSFWLLDVAAHVGTGRPYFGRRVRRMRVLYFCAEGAAWRVAHRVLAWAKHHNVKPDCMQIGVVAVPIDILNGDGPALVALIRSVRADHDDEPVWVLLDTVTAATPGANLNGPEDSSRVTSVLKDAALAAEGGAAAVHHTAKTTPDNPAGHHNFSGQVDTVLAIVESPDGTREMRNPKMRDGARLSATFFRLQQVNLGFDNEGDPLDSCVVVPTDAPAIQADGVLPAGAVKALTVLREIGRGDAVKTDTWLEACRKAGIVEVGASDSTARRSLERMANKLRSKGLLREQVSRGFHTPAEIAVTE